MAESPVSLHQGGGTLAQAVLASAPDEMLIAPIWKRIAAFMLDVLLISIILTFLTNGQLTLNLLNFELLSDLDYKMSKDYGTFFVSEEFGNSINRSTFLIDENGVIINIWRDIKNPDSHPDDVLNFLNSL